MKKCLFLMMAVAVFATGFTLTSCGGNSSQKTGVTTGPSAVTTYLQDRAIVISSPGGTLVYSVNSADGNMRLNGQLQFANGASFPVMATVEAGDFSVDSERGWFTIVFNNMGSAMEDTGFKQFFNLTDIHDVTLYQEEGDPTPQFRFTLNINEHAEGTSVSSGSADSATIKFEGISNTTTTMTVQKTFKLDTGTGEARIVPSEYAGDYVHGE